VLAAIFHRPLLFRLTRSFIARAAEQQDLKLAYKMDGTIFTGLRITDIKATPTEPGPIEQLEIGSLRLEYSLWGLLRNGSPRFSRSRSPAACRSTPPPSCASGASIPPRRSPRRSACLPPRSPF